jgi:hypothetical protein
MRSRVAGATHYEETPSTEVGRHSKHFDLASLIRPVIFRWSMLGIIVIADFVWLFWERWTVEPRSLLPRAVTGIICCTPLLTRRYRRDDKLRNLAEAIAFSLIFATAGEILSYLAVSTDRRLVDAFLAATDKTLGFDWGSYYLWATSHSHFSYAVCAAYESMGLQLWIELIYLSFTQRFSRLSEFLDLSASLLVLTIVVSLFFPAEGASKFYASQYHADVSRMFHFELLRSGSMKTINIGRMQGLISMPSYHTIMGILLCWSVRGLRLLPVLLLVNSAMLLATPFVGGHYFVDVAAGAAVTVAGIALRRYMPMNRKVLRDSPTLIGAKASQNA